jgi:hypothetical protein
MFTMFHDFFRSMKSSEERLAWLIALGADALQLAVMPLFVEGALSPVDAVLDALVAVTLVRLLGWHWAFLPTLMVEALPGADLFPTWTAAVFFVTRQMHSPGEPVILPPESPAGHGR